MGRRKKVLQIDVKKRKGESGGVPSGATIDKREMPKVRSSMDNNGEGNKTKPGTYRNFGRGGRKHGKKGLSPLKVIS